MSTPYGKRGFFWEEWEHGGDEWESLLCQFVAGFANVGIDLERLLQNNDS